MASRCWVTCERTLALILLLTGWATNGAGATETQPVRRPLDSSTGPAFELTSQEENPAGLELNFTLHWLESRAGDGGAQAYSLPGAGRCGKPGDPDLPALSRLLALPGDAEAELEILDIRTETWPDQRVAMQAAAGSDRPNTPPTQAVASPAFAETHAWPTVWARIGAGGLWQGRRVATLDIFPLRWNPATRQLEVLRSLTVRINPLHGQVQAPARRNSQVSRDLVRSGVLNSSSPWMDEPDRVEEAGIPGSYLVLMPDAALPTMQEWIDWRRQQGYEVRILLESDAGGQNASYDQLKLAVQTQFDLSPFDYLLLIGDFDHTPTGTELTYNLVADFIAGGQYADPEWGSRCNSSYCIVTDHPFSLLEGDDYFADVLVGRLSVDTINELRKIVRKSVDYEARPFLEMGSAWYHKALMIYDMAMAASRRETKLAIRDLLLDEAGFVQVDTIRNHYWSSPVSPNLVKQAVEAGVSLVNYRGFGMRNTWYGPQFDNNYVQSLQNFGRWPLVTSIVCGGGDFGSVYTDPCFGEAWLRAGDNPLEPTGAIGFIAPSEEDTHTEWNNAIDEGIYHGLVRENLSTLGALMDRGKVELWTVYPNAREWSQPCYNVPFYFHAYNLLGDPGLTLRTAAPDSILCDAPDSVAAGTQALELQLRDEHGQPIAGAWGCLHNAGLDLSLAVLSDATGRLRFACDNLAAGSWVFTAHGRNLIPFQQAIMVHSSATRLRLQSYTLSGEEPEDNLARPGEWLMLRPLLLESGDQGQSDSLLLTLTALDERAETPGPGLVLGDTTPGQVLEPGALPFRLSTLQAFGEPVPLELRLDGTLLATVEIAVSQAAFQVLQGEGIGHSLEPGTETDLRLLVHALGLPAGPGVQSRLGSLHSGVTVLRAIGQPFSLDPDSSGWVGGFRIAVDPALIRGSLAAFELGLWPEGATPGVDPLLALIHFQLALGAQEAEDPVGPDAWGHVAYHSSDTGSQAPQHVWNGIADSGTEIEVDDQFLFSWSDYPDGVSRVVDLPFTFRFFGEDWLTATVCSNGWLAFGDRRNYHTGINTPIPAAQGPGAMIATYWTDLYNWDGWRFGNLYMEHREAQGEFVVEWNGFQIAGDGSTVTFQLILRDPEMWPTSTGEGEILMHYHQVDISSETNFFTVGIEAPDEQSGLQYVFNNVYPPAAQTLVNGSSLFFTAVEEYNEVETLRPAELALMRVHPNPFNPITHMRLQLAETSLVGWRVVNLMGQTVLESPASWHAAGAMDATIDGGSLASGLYLLQAEIQGVSGERRMAREKLMLMR